MYHVRNSGTGKIPIERVQTGVRLEKRMVKVLKGLAQYMDISLGELLESLVLHSFEGRPPFSKGTAKRIEELCRIYNMDYGLESYYRLSEKG
jgi:hypothetical protein